jgi:hypothetical protein
MAWILVDTKIRKMTPALARRFATMSPVPNERPMSAARMKRLRKHIARGALPFRWACADIDDTEYRVNGQHTSNLLVEHPDMIHDKMRAVVETYMCETPQDLSALYSQIDNSLSSRTVSDVNWSFCAALPGLDNIQPIRQVINLAVTALAAEKWGADFYGRQDKEERSVLMFDEPQFVVFLHELYHKLAYKDWRVIGRTPVIRAVLSTWRKNRRDAMIFWHLVATGEGEDAKRADRVLNKHLLTTTVATGSGARAVTMGGAEGPDIMYARCIHGWNAWRQKKPTTLRVYKGKPTPKAA